MGGTAVAVGHAVRNLDVPLWMHAILPPLPLLADGLLLTQGRTFRERFMGGEFGFYELATVALGFTAFALMIVVLFRRPSLPGKALKTWFFLFALGSLYFAGEEISWGQTWLYWDTPAGFSAINKQHETNLHNLESQLFTNKIPRNLLILASMLITLIVPYRIWRNARFAPAPSRSSYWFLPTVAVFTAAVCVWLPTVPRNLGYAFLPERGETQEFYIALMLAMYAASIFVRRSNFDQATGEELPSLSSHRSTIRPT